MIETCREIDCPYGPIRLTCVLPLKLRKINRLVLLLILFSAKSLQLIRWIGTPNAMSCVVASSFQCSISGGFIEGMLEVSFILRWRLLRLLSVSGEFTSQKIQLWMLPFLSLDTEGFLGEYNRQLFAIQCTLLMHLYTLIIESVLWYHPTLYQMIYEEYWLVSRVKIALKKHFVIIIILDSVLIINIKVWREWLRWEDVSWGVPLLVRVEVFTVFIEVQQRSS